ncbi:MAG: hypothetical protein KJZ78_28725 [Bryobacteraceae bacterium]|nr:hypothetical protein [Bryobacteraceae bacterium]
MTEDSAVQDCPHGVSRRRFLAGTATVAVLGPPVPGGYAVGPRSRATDFQTAVAAVQEMILAGRIGQLLELRASLRCAAHPSSRRFWSACRDNLALLGSFTKQPFSCYARFYGSCGRNAASLGATHSFHAHYRARGGVAIHFDAGSSEANGWAQMTTRGSRATIRIDVTETVVAALMPHPDWSRERVGQAWLPIVVRCDEVVTPTPCGVTVATSGEPDRLGRAMLAAALRSHRSGTRINV